MKLLNVRLGTEDARAVARLRAKGISISEVVRRAIRIEAQRAAAPAPDADEVLATMLARFPTPADARKSGTNAASRQELKRHIQSRLRRA